MAKFTHFPPCCMESTAPPRRRGGSAPAATRPLGNAAWRDVRAAAALASSTGATFVSVHGVTLRYPEPQGAAQQRAAANCTVRDGARDAARGHAHVAGQRNARQRASAARLQEYVEKRRKAQAVAAARLKIFKVFILAMRHLRHERACEVCTTRGSSVMLRLLPPPPQQLPPRRPSMSACRRCGRCARPRYVSICGRSSGEHGQHQAVQVYMVRCCLCSRHGWGTFPREINTFIAVPKLSFNVWRAAGNRLSASSPRPRPPSPPPLADNLQL